MRIIDRYLIVTYSKVFLICFASLLGIYMVGDFVGNLHEFIDYGKVQGGLVSVLLDYYLPRVPWFFDMTSSIAGLISALFTVSWLKRNQEMTALMAAGISQFRIVLPLLLAGATISLTATLNRETTLPKARTRLTRDAQDWLGERAAPLQPKIDHVTDILIGGRYTFANEQRISEPSFQLPAWAHSFGRVLTAENAYFLPAEGDRPSGYWFKSVSQPRPITDFTSVRQGSKTVIYSPQDTSWLAKNECFVVSGIGFEQLEGGSAWAKFASTAELVRGLRDPSYDYGADVRVAIHARLMQPFCDMTLLFLGLPVILSDRMKNVFVASSICLVVVALFFGVTITCHSLGMNYLVRPVLAVWCPLLIFVPVAVFFSEPLRR